MWGVHSEGWGMGSKGREAGWNPGVPVLKVKGWVLFWLQWEAPLGCKRQDHEVIHILKRILWVNLDNMVMVAAP